MRRRNFLKVSAAAFASPAIPYLSFGEGSDSPVIYKNGMAEVDEKLQRLGPDIFRDDYVNFDIKHFAAAPRIFFVSPFFGYISIVPRRGIGTIDLRVTMKGGTAIAPQGKDFITERELWQHPYSSVRQNGVSFNNENITVYEGVNRDAVDIPIAIEQIPHITYRLDTKKAAAKNWTYGREWKVKTPYVCFKDGEKIKIVFVGDLHVFDDADSDERIITDPYLSLKRMHGSTVDMFLNKLMSSPDYVPERRSEAGKLMNAFCLASNLYRVMKMEVQPHAVIIGGDQNFKGAFHKWEGHGLPYRGSTIDQYGGAQNEKQLVMERGDLNLRMQINSISQFIPVYFIRGNHDWPTFHPHLLEEAEKSELKYFKHPNTITGKGIYYSLRFMAAGEGKSANHTKIVIFDSESYLPDVPKCPTDYTMGEQQKFDIENELTASVDYEHITLHGHRFAGIKGGPKMIPGDGKAYGRTGAFTVEDYRAAFDKGFFDGDPEQVEYTQLANLCLKTKNLKCVSTFHDHGKAARMVESPEGKFWQSVDGTSKAKFEKNWYEQPGMIFGYGNPEGAFAKGKGERNCGIMGPPGTIGGSGFTIREYGKDDIEERYVLGAPCNRGLNFTNSTIPCLYSPGDILFETVIPD